MKNNFIGEVIISLSLIGLLVFFIKPLDLIMPLSLHPFMTPFLLILFVVFSGFIWRENPGDEREQLHKYISSRFAYFAAVSVLILAIVIESMNQRIDPWLIIAICVILLAKILGHIYAHIKH